MKYKWLNKLNNDKLIIFYNGWGMDDTVVKHLNFNDFDVVMFYDYNDLSADFAVDKYYKEVNVIAWSMGVMIAGIINNKCDRFIAINGTFKPIDENFGINPKIYDLTINGFDEVGREKFIRKMFNENKELKINRSIENQKSELIALKNYSCSNFIKPNKIIISDNDKIIPTKNQCSFWKIQPNITGGHCPFLEYNSWSEICYE